MKRQALKPGRLPLRERARRPEDSPRFAIGNPIRIQALALLHEGPQSPRGIADILDVELKTVTHHMRELYDAGCIEFVGHQGEGNVRRAVYRAVTRPVVSLEEYRAMSEAERNDLNAGALQWILAEVLAALENGTMSRDENLCLISDEPSLDVKGKEEARDLFTAVWGGEPNDAFDALQSLQEIESRAANRMAETKEEGTRVVVALLAFERGRSRKPKGDSQLRKK